MQEYIHLMQKKATVKEYKNKKGTKHMETNTKEIHYKKGKLQTNVTHEYRCKALKKYSQIKSNNVYKELHTEPSGIYHRYARLVQHLKINLFNLSQQQAKEENSHDHIIRIRKSM